MVANSSVNKFVKCVFDCCREFHFSLDVHYVPSSKNPADSPSRKVSGIECTLSVRAWGQVELLFEPHTFDLVSLDSDCQHDERNRPVIAPLYTLCNPVFWRN